jgi:hypothetical protein
VVGFRLFGQRRRFGMSVDRVARANRKALSARPTTEALELRTNTDGLYIHKRDGILGAGGMTGPTAGAQTPVNNVLQSFYLIQSVIRLRCTEILISGT